MRATRPQGRCSVCYGLLPGPCGAGVELGRICACRAAAGLGAGGLPVDAARARSLTRLCSQLSDAHFRLHTRPSVSTHDAVRVHGYCGSHA